MSEDREIKLKKKRIGRWEEGKRNPLLNETNYRLTVMFPSKIVIHTWEAGPCNFLTVGLGAVPLPCLIYHCTTSY